ncbi:MAG: PIN domain-containing protein [Xanthomonadales bacterium]|nr:PIN domain-containing protein [Xanthomonadales bacterium]
MMRIAVDTNVLVYAHGGNDPVRQRLALDVLDALAGHCVLVPVQVLGELFNVLTRKARWPKEQARDVVLSTHDNLPTIETSFSMLVAAVDLCVVHGFSTWDAVVLSAAAEADCRLLLSEDMHDGFVWRGMTIVNPFAAERHPLLQQALVQSG